MNLRVATVAVMVVGITSIGGCAAPHPPCVASIPSAAGGDSYLYSIEGKLRTFSGHAIAHWPMDSPLYPNHGDLTLPKGATMEIAVSGAPQARLDFVGEMRQATQFSYWAKHPDESRPLWFADEWIDAATSQMVQTTNPAHGRGETYVAHITFMSHFMQPGVLFSPVFWNQEIQHGSGAMIETPWYGGRPVNGTTGHDFIAWSATTVELDGVCHAKVDLRLDMGTAYEGNAIFRDGVAVPLELQISLRDQEKFNLKLIAYELGSGVALPSWQQQPKFAPGSPTFDAPGFFGPPYSTPITAFHEALEFAKDDAEVEGWLKAHPGAQVAAVDYHKALPGASMVDRWVFQWSDGAVMSPAFSVANETSLVPLGSSLRVAMVGSGASEVPRQLGERRIAFMEAERRFSAHNSGNMDAIRCFDMDSNSPPMCSIGNVEGRGGFYADGTYSGKPILIGMVIDATTGEVYQEHSYDEGFVGSPTLHRLVAD